MRPLLITILLFNFYCSSGQSFHKKVFKETVYVHNNGKTIDREIFSSVSIADEKLDLYFYQRHFSSPSQLPEKFVDSEYKNQTIAVWNDTTKTDDLKVNSKKTYAYDNVGRLIQYSWSSCIVCSSMAYQYNVTYNANGRVDKISKVNNETTYKFHYNKRGDIIKCEKFFFGNLESVVDLLN